VSAFGIAWAVVSELLPLAPKMLGGVALAAVATFGSLKAWQKEKKRKAEQDED